MKSLIIVSKSWKWRSKRLSWGLALLFHFEATTDEVADLRKENQRLKEMVADLMLRYDVVKKSLTILG